MPSKYLNIYSVAIFVNKQLDAQFFLLYLFIPVLYMSYDAHLATAPQYIPTQHDMLPQHLVCKYELNCEYRNITLAKNKAP